MSYRTHNDVCGNFFIAFCKERKQNMRKEHTKRLVVCAIMIALATVLSELLKLFDSPFGGGVTLFSMVPIIAIGLLFGIKWGMGAAFAYSVIQALFGLGNIFYLGNFWSNLAVALLDYLIAYTVLGLAGFFRLEEQDTLKAATCKVSLAVSVGCVLRFLCHFLSGIFLWNSITSTELSAFEFPWGAEVELPVIAYSALYNGWFMAIELITCLVALLCLRTVLLRLRKQLELA